MPKNFKDTDYSELMYQNSTEMSDDKNKENFSARREKQIRQSLLNQKGEGAQLYTGLSTKDATKKITDLEGMPYAANLQERGMQDYLADSQTGWQMLGRSLTQAIGGQVIGGTLANIGYLYDIPSMVSQFEGTETEWGNNWLSKAGNQLQKNISEKIAPIYQTEAAEKGWAPTDATWWASMAPSIFSSASLILPTMGTVRGVQLASRLLGIGKKMGTTAALGTQTIGSALTSRHMYSTTESYELFTREKERYMQEGRSEEEAAHLAGQAASFNYRIGYTNLWKDMATWGMVLHGFNFARAGVQQNIVEAAKRAPADSGAQRILQAFKGGADNLKKAAITSKALESHVLLKHALLEGVEEYNIQWQKKEGERRGKRIAGELSTAEENTNFIERLGEHTLDRHTWDSFFWGSLGGLTFGGLNRVGARLFNKGKVESEQERINGFADRSNYFADQARIASRASLEGDTRGYQAVVDNMVTELGIRGSQEGTIGLDIELAEIVSKMSSEQLEQAGLTTEASKVAAETVPKLKQFEAMYNKNMNRSYGTKNDSEIAGQLTVLEYRTGLARDNVSTSRQAIDSYLSEFKPYPTELSATGLAVIHANTEVQAIENDLQHLNKLLSEVDSENTIADVKKGIPVIKQTIQIQRDALAKAKRKQKRLKEDLNNSPEEQQEIDNKYIDSPIDGEFSDRYTDYVRDQRTLEYIESNLKELRNPEAQKKFVEDVEESIRTRMGNTPKWDLLDDYVERSKLVDLAGQLELIEQSPDGRGTRQFKGQFEITLENNEGGKEVKTVQFEDLTENGLKVKEVVEGKLGATMILNQDNTIKDSKYSRWSNPQIVKSAQDIRTDAHKVALRQVYGDKFKQRQQALENSRAKLENGLRFQNLVNKKLLAAMKNTTKTARIQIRDPKIKRGIQRALFIRNEDVENKAVISLSIAQLERLQKVIGNSIGELQADITQAETTLQQLEDHINNFNLTEYEDSLELQRQATLTARETLTNSEKLRDQFAQKISNYKSYLKGLHTRLQKLYDKKIDLDATMEEMAEDGIPTGQDASVYAQAISDISQEIRHLQDNKIPQAIERLEMSEQQLEQAEQSLKELQDSFKDVFKEYLQYRNEYNRFVDAYFSTFSIPKESVAHSKFVGTQDIESEYREGLGTPDIPMQPFTNNVSDLARTSASMKYYIARTKDGTDAFEPQMLFQNFIDTYDLNTNPTSDNYRTVHAYNKRTLLNKFDDILTDSQKEELTDNAYDDVVYLVVTDKKGEAVQVDSTLNSGQKTIMFAPLNGVKRNKDGTPLNERFTLDPETQAYPPVVDLSKRIEYYQKEQKLSKEDAERQARADFITIANEYQNKVINPVLESESSVPFTIQGKTPGVRASYLLSKEQQVEPVTAGEALVDGDNKLGEVEIYISYSNKDRVTIDGTEYRFPKGHVGFKYGGRLIYANRETIRAQDRDRVVEFLQLAMTKQTVEESMPIVKEINKTAYMFFLEKKGRTTISPYNFYIKSSGTGKEATVTGVVFGENTITKEELLNPVENADKIEALKTFLSTKYYNVDQVSQDAHRAKKPFILSKATLNIENGRIKDGVIDVEREYTYKEGGYNTYLLHSESPKLTVNLAPRGETTLDAISNPQFLSRSIRAVPENIAERPQTTETLEPAAPTKKVFTSSLGDQFFDETSNAKSREEVGTILNDNYFSQVKSEFDSEAETLASQYMEKSAMNLTQFRNNMKKLVNELVEKGYIETSPTTEVSDQAATSETSLASPWDASDVDAFTQAANEEASGQPTSDQISTTIEGELTADDILDTTTTPPDDTEAPFRVSRGEGVATTQERTEALEVFRQILPDTVMKIVEQNVLGEGVDARMTSNRDNAITLVSKYSAPFSEIHEAWHNVSLLYTTESERTNLYNELREHLGNRRVSVQDGDRMIETVGKEMTNRQAEEFLAEEFRNYVMVGRENYKFGKDSVIKRNIFQRIWDTLVDLILGKGMHLNNDLRNNPEFLTRKFDEVLSTEYRVADRLDRSNITIDKIGVATTAESREIVQAVNYEFFNALKRFKKEGYTDLNKNTVQQMYAGLKAVYENRLKKNPNNKVLQFILNNWAQTKIEHAKYLRQYNISFDINNVLTAEEKNHKNNNDWIESNRIDVRQSMPNEFKLLIAGLKSPQLSPSGFPQTVPFARTVGILHRELANLPNEAAMVQRLQELSRTKHPEFKELLDILGIESAENITPVTLDETTFKLQNAFFTQLHKSINDYVTGLISAEGKIYLTDAVSSTVERQVMDQWRNNVRLGIENNSAVTPESMRKLYNNQITPQEATKRANEYNTRLKNTFSKLFNYKDGQYFLNSDATFKVGGVTMNILDFNVNRIKQETKDNTKELLVYTSILNGFGISVTPNLNNFKAIQNAAIQLRDYISKANENIKKLKTKKQLTIDDIFNRDVVKVNKELKELANIQAKETGHFIDNQVITSKGTEYSLMEKNNIGKLVDNLNTGVIPEIFTPFQDGQGSLVNPILPESIAGNTNTMTSVWLSHIQDNPNAISKSILRNLGPEVGDKVDISDLVQTDYDAMFINSTLQGIFPFIRASERGLEYAFNFGKSFVTTNTYSDQLNIKNRQGDNMFVKRLKGYLFSEILSAIAFNNSTELGRLVKGKNNKGLSHFKHVIPELENRINQKKYQGLDQSQWWDAAREIIETNDVKITDKLVKYIKNERNRTIEAWLDRETITKPKDSSTYTVNTISSEVLQSVLQTNNPELTRWQLDRLVDAFNYNHLTSFIEQTKLVVGDPLIYLKKSGESDLFKRTTTFASTITGALNHEGFINYMNTHYPRTDGYEHSTNYRDFVFADVKVDSRYSEIYSQVLGTLANAYKGMAENDAGGISTLDGTRALAIRTNTWNQNQEETFQYEAQILANEMLQRGIIDIAEYKKRFEGHLPKTFDSKKKYYKGQEINIEKLTPLQIRKPQGTGFLRNEGIAQANRPQITKTGLAPLLPSDFVGNDAMIDYMIDLANNGIDFVFPESAKKGDIIGNEQGQLSQMYSKEGVFNKIGELIENEGFIAEEISWNDIGDQMEIDPSGHGNVTRSSQERRLGWIDMYDSGKLSPQFEKYSDLYNEKTELERQLVRKGIATVQNDLGLSLKEGTKNDFNLTDKPKFRAALLREFNKRTMPDNVAEGVDMVIQASQQVFDALPTKRQVTNVLQGMIRAKAISLKVNGDMMIQQPSTGFESGPRTVGQSNFLKFYRPVDINGNEVSDMKNAVSIAPAEAMISLPKRWIPYVKAFYPAITFEESLARFNNDLQNPESTAYKHFEKIRNIIATRIPGQGRNSMEALRIHKFLSPLGGSRIVLPTEIVAKSGSDFDIDKLTTYLNNVWFDNKAEGRNKLIPNYAEYTKESSEKRDIENRLNEINRTLILDVDNFESLIRPNDAGIVKQQADKIEKTTPVPNHQLLSFDHNSNVAKAYWESNTLVGALAVHNVAHASTQISPIHLNSNLIQPLITKYDEGSDLYLGHVADSQGNNIAKTIAEFLTAAVDAQKESKPSIFKVNMTMQTSNAYMLLNRMGDANNKPASIRHLTNFFTSEPVKMYTKRRNIAESKISEAKGNREQKKETVINVLKDLGITLPKDYVFLYETFNDYMSLDHRRLSKEQLDAAKQDVIEHINHIKEKHSNLSTSKGIKSDPLGVMEAFLYSLETGKVLSKLQSITRPDATLPKDRNTIKIIQRQRERLEAAGVFTEKGNIQSLLNKTFIGEFQNAHNKSLDMFKGFYLSELDKRMQQFMWGKKAEKDNPAKTGVIDIYDNPKINKPIADIEEAMRKIENSLITHILHTIKRDGRSINSRYEQLVKGQNSLVKRAPKIQALVKDNLFLEEIVPISQEYIRKRGKNAETDYFKTFNRKFAVEDSNALTESIRELLDHRNQDVRQFALDLIEFSLIQSGVQSSFTSFFELLPAEHYYPVVMGILDQHINGDMVFDGNTSDFVFSNLSHDNNVVPRHTNYRDLKNNNKELHLSQKNQNTTYPYLAVEVNAENQKISKELKAEGIPVPKKILLFKRTDNYKKGKRVYQQIDKYGDGPRLQEHYTTTNKKSIIQDNRVTIKDNDPNDMPDFGDTGMPNVPSYFQRENLSSIKPNKEITTAVNRFLETIGVEVNNVPQIYDRMNKVVGDENGGIIAVADISRRTIDIIEGRADITSLPEEAAHFYVELLGDRNPLYRKMRSEITNYEIYDNVVQEYKNTYNNNKDMLLKEAIGKAIAMKITNQPMNLSKTQNTQMNNWWRALWNQIKQMFGIQGNAFSKAAYNIMNNNMESLNTEAIQSETALIGEEGVYFQRSDNTQRRLEMLDDVRLARKRQQEREQKRKEYIESLKKRDQPSKVNSEVTSENVQEVNKIESLEGIDAMKSELFTNFDKYFPAYDNFSAQEKTDFINMMSEGELEIYC